MDRYTMKIRDILYIVMLGKLDSYRYLHMAVETNFNYKRPMET